MKTALLAALLALALATPALADSITASATPSSTQAGRFTLTVTAATDAQQPVYALARPEGAPCAANYAADKGVSLANGALVTGTVSISHDVTASGGNYIVCAWLGTGAPVSTTFSEPIIACGNDNQPPTLTLVSRCVTPSCIVPKLSRKLPTAKARLKAAGCRVGTVTRVRSHKYASGTVIRYTSTPGKQRSLGAKIGIVVAR